MHANAVTCGADKKNLSTGVTAHPEHHYNEDRGYLCYLMYHFEQRNSIIILSLQQKSLTSHNEQVSSTLAKNHN